MTIKTKSTPVDGLRVLGETFIPVGEGASQAIFERNGRTCGITYKNGAVRPYLRCAPGYQLPPWARDGRSWKRFTWSCEDNRAINITVDERDGELIYCGRNISKGEDIAAAVEDCLDLLLGDVFYSELVGYVRALTPTTIKSPR